MREEACGIAQAWPDTGIPFTSLLEEWGWYLYAISWRNQLSQTPLTEVLESTEGLRVQIVSCGDLAALVRRVPLSEFTAEAVRARRHDVAWLEAMAREHERVVQAAHRENTVLPAKLGCVYASAESLVTALESAHDGLVAQLRRLEACDEWGVRFYADRPAIRQHVAAENRHMVQLHEDLAAASPGRAYFLKRKLVETLATATAQTLSDLAQLAYDRMAVHSLDGRINSRISAPCPVQDNDAEILRAAFLVSRTQKDAFVEEVHGFALSNEGLRCEYSGPWAPYSFATIEER